MTDNLKEIYSANKNVRVYECIVLEHPLFSKTYYLVNDNVSHTFNGVEYLACPFEITLPTKGENQQDLAIVLPNIGWDIIKELDNAIEDVYSEIKVRLEIWTDVLEAEIPSLVFSQISVDKNTVSGVGIRKDLFSHYINENAIFDIRFEGLFL
jgi:hypothetical protein